MYSNKSSSYWSKSLIHQIKLKVIFYCEVKLYHGAESRAYAWLYASVAQDICKFGEVLLKNGITGATIFLL